MGVGIAASFPAYGDKTILLGRDLKKAELNLSKVELCADTINPTWRDSGAQLIPGSIADWSDWQNTDLIIETVSERLDLKKNSLASLINVCRPIFRLAATVRAFLLAILHKVL
jgi:3-hydroxybutyryl-CoA dehydrogenase